MAKEYNINELLEKKKHFESQIEEKLIVRAEELTYVEEITLDRINSKNNRTVIPKQRVNLKAFTQEMNGIIDELYETKKAIQRYNTGNVLELIQERNAVRTKTRLLKEIKKHLPRDMKKGRNVLSQDREGNPIEIRESILEPMFDVGSVDKQLNELAAQERKLNTEIQKLNLNAKITL